MPGGLGPTITLVDSLGRPLSVVNQVLQVGGTITVVPSGVQAVSSTDGALVTIGSEADSANFNFATPGTVIAFLKGIVGTLNGFLAVNATQTTIPWVTQNQTSTTGVKTNVASSASSVTLLASNGARKQAMIYNDSTQILYLDLTGGTASSTSYSTQVPSQTLFELPGPAIYSGLITGIWASANGAARITEFA